MDEQVRKSCQEILTPYLIRQQIDDQNFLSEEELKALNSESSDSTLMSEEEILDHLKTLVAKYVEYRCVCKQGHSLPQSGANSVC